MTLTRDQVSFEFQVSRKNREPAESNRDHAEVDERTVAVEFSAPRAGQADLKRELETGNSKLSSSIHLLLHDVDIHCGRIAQEAMHRREKQVSAPAAGGRVSEDHLGDVFFADKFRHRRGDIFAL
jgi:hypothetical protein